MTKPLNPHTDCIIIADLGPNPAPLSELIWALFRQRGLRVKAVFLTTYNKAETYLKGEFLQPRAALDQLRSVLGPSILTHADVFVERVYDEGTVLNDEITYAQTLAWSEARWRSALKAQAAAGEAPVIFGLIGGRRRTMSAQQAVLFQLLARPQDLCIDVRVSNPNVEGGTGFFFPEQPQQQVFGRRDRQVTATEPIIAAEVEIILIDVPVPRLRALIPASALSSHQAALQATNSALTAATPPRVVLDYAKPSVSVNGERLKLSTAQLIWYATLLARRAAATDDMGWVKATDLQALEHTIETFEATSVKPFSYKRSQFLYRLFNDPAQKTHWLKCAPTGKLIDENAANFSKLRADTRAKIRDLISHQPFGHLLIPVLLNDSDEHATKFTAQRITLDPSCIECRPHNALL